MVEVSNDFHRMASQEGFEPPTSPLGAHEACVKKARYLGKNVYYVK